MRAWSIPNMTPIFAGAENQHAVKTHCKWGHEFTPENTRTDSGQRRCRACERERSKRRNAKEM
jgi:hypothetical protein